MLEEQTCDYDFIYKWAEPIGDGRGPACGVEATFSPEFEFIKDEVDKSSSLHENNGTNWQLVLERSNAFLTEQSKDLWVLCYGLRAVYEKHGLSSLVAALEVLKAVLENFWDQLHPSLKRPQRRAAPLAWLAGKLEMIVAGTAFPKDEDQIAQKLKKALEALQKILDQKLNEISPSFAGVLKGLKNLKPPQESVPPAPDFEAALATAILTSPSPANRAIPAQPFELQVSSDGQIAANQLPQVFRAIKEQAQLLAAHLAGRNILDWRVYLLHRTSLWSTISQLPQADPDLITQLRPVPSDLVASYTAAVEAGRLAEILPRLERSASKMPFWFDGHYLVDKCLEGLKAREALNILRLTLGLFIREFPELIDYKYFDKSPFASPKTLHWLASLDTMDDGTLGRLAGAVKVSSPPKEGSEDQELILKQALDLWRDGDFEAGLKRVGPQLATKSRASIKQGLLVARYCLGAGRPEAAGNLLGDLFDNLESWGLLEWEPELTADILTLIVYVYTFLKQEVPVMVRQKLYWFNLETALQAF
ncbi:MAG: type VI secretion system protein TssA [Deltaproteobacteria bacterium]|jgi:type VI secretion system protein VasJ|nr:type VI secretion system protein TssA [Deltaproteobacteria bacterium]